MIRSMVFMMVIWRQTRISLKELFSLSLVIHRRFPNGRFSMLIMIVMLVIGTVFLMTTLILKKKMKLVVIIVLLFFV